MGSLALLLQSHLSGLFPEDLGDPQGLDSTWLELEFLSTLRSENCLVNVFSMVFLPSRMEFHSVHAQTSAQKVGSSLWIAEALFMLYFGSFP